MPAWPTALAVFCCVGALAIVDALEHVDQDLLGWWLCERQLPNGGLNGRPEKLEDVCYSWWCLSALSILQRLHWIDRDKLVQFILSCQDTETGGISDRPGNYVDVFHTVFGIAGECPAPRRCGRAAGAQAQRRPARTFMSAVRPLAQACLCLGTKGSKR